MVRKYGPIEAYAALGLFARLQQRTAMLPQKYRGWILSAQLESAPGALLARELGLDDQQFARFASILVDVGWLEHKAFRAFGKPIRGNPAQKFHKTETKTKTKTKTETKTRRNAKTTFLPDDPASVFAFEPNASGQAPTDPSSAKARIHQLLGLAINGRLTKDQRSDLITVSRAVDHVWPDRYQAAEQFARNAASDDRVRNRIAYWVARLKKEGFWYAETSVSQIRSNPAAVGSRV